MRAQEFLPEKVNPETIEPGYKIRRQLPNGFIIQASAMKPYLDDPDPDMRELRGVEIRVFDPEAKGWINQTYGIAEVRFLARKNRETGEWNLRPTSVQVKDEYRRQGIASAMYNFARRLGNDIVPGAAQTDMGRAFWQGGAGQGRDLDVKDIPEPAAAEPIPEPQPAEEPNAPPQQSTWRDRWRRILFPDKETA